MLGFVTYRQAIGLRQLSYDVPAFARYYNEKFEFNTNCGPTDYNAGTFMNSISAPLNSQVITWLREKWGFDCSFDVAKVEFESEAEKVTTIGQRDHQYQIYTLVQPGDESRYWDGGYRLTHDKDGFPTMEEAERDCIETCLELVADRIVAQMTKDSKVAKLRNE